MVQFRKKCQPRQTFFPEFNLYMILNVCIFSLSILLNNVNQLLHQMNLKMLIFRNESILSMDSVSKTALKSVLFRTALWLFELYLIDYLIRNSGILIIRIQYANIECLIHAATMVTSVNKSIDFFTLMLNRACPLFL